ncbi:hypothetical protein QA634_28065 [Methylobacterium sp. CB376]|uniref:hypothetical protein n=1 Tax=unclassified Methylobacterium TaxID=2615210 RepID=UPI0002DA6A3F|nr:MULTISPECIES: hypothetical protein [Methylobacterium]WFT79057.1 hypothetical protein QA634_28065 [Methylobacterium nodulans]
MRLGICATASDVEVLATVPDTPEGVAILDFVAAATLRALSLAELEAAARGGDAA